MKEFPVPQAVMPMSATYLGCTLHGMEEIPNGDYLGRRLTPGLIRDCWELNEYLFTAERLNDTGIVIDLGANFGAAAFCAAYVSPKVKVLAVEADKWNFGCLCKNVIENKMVGRIFPVHCAAHAAVGWQYVLSGITASHVLTDLPQPSQLASGVYGVPTKSLKAIFDEYDIGKCDVLKVDIEGSEFAMFGAADRETMQRARFITMEVHGTGRVEGAPMVDAMVEKLRETHYVEWPGSNVHGGPLWATRK
jgi:FkbM family methyltransferase